MGTPERLPSATNVRRNCHDLRRIFSETKQILEECKPLVRELKLEEFNAKMNELIQLQDKYLKERQTDVI